MSSLLFATGCPKYRPSVNFDRNGFVKQINDHFAAKQRDYFNALGGKDNATAKIRRNELIEDALPYIDEAYMDFITALQSGRDRNNFVADVIELGTTGAVGITNGERPLQILGVALTAFRGGRRSADLNFFKEQTTPVLISKMDGNRAEVRATILNREKEEVTTYSMGAAIGDIVEYYNAGTLVRAFTALAQDTAVQTKKSEDDVLVLKGVPITPEAPKEFRDLSVAAGMAITSLGVDLAGSDAAKKAAATTRLQRIVAALEDDKAAGAALKNIPVSSKDNGDTLINALIDIRAAADLVNDRALLNTINQAIVDIMAKPLPAASPAASPTPSPTASPTASPTM
jgi:hypothetical protein